MLILHGLPVSSYTTKVRIALHAKGLAFEERAPAGGYRSAQWRTIVATGTIPAIEHDGFILAESEAIIEYIDEIFPEPTLFPGNARERAHIRRLARLHDTLVEPAVRALFPLIRDPSLRHRLPELTHTLVGRLEQLAATTQPSPWMAGSAFSSADCGFAVSLPLARRLLEAMGQPLPLPAPIEDWLSLSEANAAVQAGLAPWRPATESWLEQATGGAR